VINIPSHESDPESRLILQDEYVIRRKAAEFGIPVVTNLELARVLIKSLITYNEKREAQSAIPVREPSLINVAA
jgi:hypothetical protein